MFEVSDSTPIVQLTIGQFWELIEKRYGKQQLSSQNRLANTNLVYGIRGIEQLFHVSHKTAQAYKNGFLKPAVSQNGRKILIDRDLAIKLFAEHEEKGGVR